MPPEMLLDKIFNYGVPAAQTFLIGFAAFKYMPKLLDSWNGTNNALSKIANNVENVEKSVQRLEMDVVSTREEVSKVKTELTLVKNQHNTVLSMMIKTEEFL